MDGLRLFFEYLLFKNKQKNALDDLVDLNFGHPALPQRTAASRDPWSPQGGADDPWGGGASAVPPADPWGGVAGALGAPAALSVLDAPLSRVANQDPWGGPQPTPQTQGKNSSYFIFISLFFQLKYHAYTEILLFQSWLIRGEPLPPPCLRNLGGPLQPPPPPLSLGEDLTILRQLNKIYFHNQVVIFLIFLDIRIKLYSIWV